MYLSICRRFKSKKIIGSPIRKSAISKKIYGLQIENPHIVSFVEGPQIREKNYKSTNLLYNRNQ
jgi:hypothetical protein